MEASAATSRLDRAAVAVALLAVTLSGCVGGTSQFPSGEVVLATLEDTALACREEPQVGDGELWSCPTDTGVLNARVIEDDQTFALTVSLLADSLPGQVVIGGNWVAIAPDDETAAELASIHDGAVVRSADDVPMP